MNKISIIGSGFSSMSAACYLASYGYEVNVYEKNDQIGGRARIMKKDGFTFDMGPSWYWMPDAFEKFFSDFDKKVSDYYNLLRLSPAYRVYFEDSSFIEIPNSIEAIYDIFEKEEPGSAKQLKAFLKKSQFNYETAIQNLVYKPGLSPLELITPKTVANVNQFFTSISQDVRKRFKSKKLIAILEFPVLFLGAKAQDTPSFYSFMNYADFVLGTWYPEGGMFKVVEAMESLAIELGVKFHTSSNVKKILTENGKVTGLQIDNEIVPSDLVVSGADYHHTESLLSTNERSYSEKYWEKRVFAPSALLYYVGFDRKLDNIRHHMLFFDEDIDPHAENIYDHPAWPESPLFYGSFPSVSDKSVAPSNHELGFYLIPIAPGLKDTEDLKEKYFDIIIDRMEKHTGQSLRKNIIFKHSYSVSNFKEDYNSYKGNAYGMANTLRQTAFLRPSIKSKKVKNLYFTGQLTVPGPGVPPSLISGKIVADQIMKQFTKPKKHEVTL